MDKIVSINVRQRKLTMLGKGGRRNEILETFPSDQIDKGGEHFYTEQNNDYAV